MLNRREFLGAAAAAGWMARRAQAAETNIGYPGARYRKAIVVDACGSLGEYDPSLPDGAPLTARGLADARQSGVTLLHVTVNSVGNGSNKFIDTGFSSALCSGCH